MFWTEFWKMESDANLIIFIFCGDQLMADAFIACVVNKTKDEEIGDRKVSPIYKKKTLSQVIKLKIQIIYLFF